MSCWRFSKNLTLGHNSPGLFCFVGAALKQGGELAELLGSEILGTVGGLDVESCQLFGRDGGGQEAAQHFAALAEDEAEQRIELGEIDRQARCGQGGELHDAADDLGRW